MNKFFLLILVLVFLVAGCGQKSTIKNAVKAQRLADVYGDGKHVIKHLTFPLFSSPLAYQTPLPGLGPIAGGILKFVGDIFAKNTDMGKLQMSYTQPIPEIPSKVLNSVKLKRIFFYMKPSGKQRRYIDWFGRLVMGKGHVTFAFLDKLAVRMTATKVGHPESFVPLLLTKEYDKKDASTLMQVFSKNYNHNVIDKMANDIILLKYDQSKKASDTRRKDFGQIHIIETVHPIGTKHFLMDHPIMKGLFKRLLIMDNSLLVELVKDPIANESFKEIISEFGEEKNLGITNIDTCTPDSCLELNVPDVNLIPLAMKGNALKLEAVIHAGKVPQSFNLKGFVEFEVKVDSPI